MSSVGSKPVSVTAGIRKELFKELCSIVFQPPGGMNLAVRLSSLLWRHAVEHVQANLT